MGAKAKARRRSEEEGKVRMVPFRGFAPSLYVATAEVQGAVAAGAEAIVGLRRGTAVTRAQSQTAAVGPAGARLLDIRVPQARGLLSDQWIRGYHDPSTGVWIWTSG